MELVIAKDTVPKYKKDLEVSVKTIQAMDDLIKLNHLRKPITSLDILFRTGLEHVLFYSHVENLSEITKNILEIVPKEIPQSVHSPYNLENPEKADVTSEEGKTMIKEVIDFTSEIGGKVVVAHPNIVLFTQEKLAKFDYKMAIIKLIENSKELREYAAKKNILFTIENILFPSTNREHTDLLFNLGNITLEESIELVKNGILLTEDTCHRAISRSTINSVLSKKEEGKKSIESVTKERNVWGLPERLYIKQPTLREINEVLKNNIIHIHLNDGRRMNKNKQKWKGPENVTIYDEALNIGEGGMCQHEDIFPIIKHHALKNDLSELFVVIEVYETFSSTGENPYNTPLNYQIGAIDLYTAIVQEFTKTL